MAALNVQDPLRNALRGLVSAGHISGWCEINGLWTVTLPDGPTTTYTASGVNDLIGMFWSVTG